MITYNEMLEIREEELAFDALDYPFCWDAMTAPTACLATQDYRATQR